MQRLIVDKIQRPRRTAEFQEEPETATKRQSRLQRRGTFSEQTPTYAGTTQKHSTRLRISATGSATRVRSFLTTPQKTPNTLHKQSSRALFTAEKQRSTLGALHNDKKWIQDQTQRITEYLKQAWNPAGMGGISSEFFTRSNCLKQMSIKQFVAIINHFLHMIWGNRFSVGSNHVEDIVNILQKLNYPHQVNRSWLKTPNTTHSFGNVIVLFDFLMDFVPPTEFELPLSELQENHELEPDLEFKAALLHTCEITFHLWDKNLEDEFQKMKRQLADMLVQKHCGVAGLDALDKELNRLYEYRNTLNFQLPQISAEDERECERLRKFVNNAKKELEQLGECCKKYDLQLEQLLSKKGNSSSQLTRLKENIKMMKKTIPEQLCNINERDACVEKLKELRLELQCHDRTVEELRNRDYRQQVQLSVIKMNATQEIENLNKILRDITFTLGITQSEFQHEISLNAKAETVKSLMPELNSLQKRIVKELKKSKEALNRTEKDLEKLNYEAHVANEPRVKAQESTRMIIIKRQEQLEKHIVKDFEVIFLSIQNLDLELSQLQMDLEHQQQQITNKRNAINQLEQECEELMSKAEQEHNTAAEAREKYLHERESNLSVCMNQLKELGEIVMHDKENDPSFLANR